MGDGKAVVTSPMEIGSKVAAVMAGAKPMSFAPTAVRTVEFTIGKIARGKSTTSPTVLHTS